MLYHHWTTTENVHGLNACPKNRGKSQKDYAFTKGQSRYLQLSTLNWMVCMQRRPQRRRFKPGEGNQRTSLLMSVSTKAREGFLQLNTQKRSTRDHIFFALKINTSCGETLTQNTIRYDSHICLALTFTTPFLSFLRLL